MMKKSYTKHMEAEENYSEMCVLFSEHTDSFKKEYYQSTEDMIELLKVDLKQKQLEKSTQQLTRKNDV